MIEGYEDLLLEIYTPSSVDGFSPEASSVEGEGLDSWQVRGPHALPSTRSAHLRLLAIASLLRRMAPPTRDEAISVLEEGGFLSEALLLGAVPSAEMPLRSCATTGESGATRGLSPRGVRLYDEGWRTAAGRELQAIWPMEIAGSGGAPSLLQLTSGINAVAVRKRVKIAGVGSRTISPCAVGLAKEIGSALTETGNLLVSGGAHGADAAFTSGALSSGESIRIGCAETADAQESDFRVLTLLPCGLSRHAMPRSGLHDRTSDAPQRNSGEVFASAFDPWAPFSAARAMIRNTLIVDAADLIVVAGAHYRRGGGWAVATESLRRHRPLAIFDVPDATPEDRRAAESLIGLGAIPLRSVAEFRHLQRWLAEDRSAWTFRERLESAGLVSRRMQPSLQLAG